MYKTINDWTKKKMIEQIKLKNNGIKAINSRGLCAYRSEDNNCCVVGCFIPDKEYEEISELLDGMTSREVIKVFEDMFPLTRSGMMELQGIHDNYEEELSILSLHETLENWINANVEDETH